jgi:hypothetical protein
MNVLAQLVGISSQLQKISSLSLGQANSIVMILKNYALLFAKGSPFIDKTHFPVLFTNLGFKSLFIFAGFNVFISIFVWSILLGTKGVSLEETAAIFGGVSRVLA